MRVFKHFHNEWKADSGRDDENVKIIANKQNNDALHFYLIKIIWKDLDVENPTNNQIYSRGDCH